MSSELALTTTVGIHFDFMRTFKNRYILRIVGKIFEKLLLLFGVEAKCFDPYWVVVRMQSKKNVWKNIEILM